MTTISTHLLLSLAHIIDYALAFNRYNEKLCNYYQRYFDEAGANMNDILDPFQPYENALQDLQKIYDMVGVNDHKAAIQALRDLRTPENMVDEKVVSDDIAVDSDWIFRVISEAITRYEERHVFMILGGECYDELINALGEDRYLNMREEFISGKIGGQMVCGNADQSIRMAKEWLEEEGKPYARPPLPYLEKHHERYRELREQVAQHINSRQTQDKTNSGA